MLLYRLLIKKYMFAFISFYIRTCLFFFYFFFHVVFFLLTPTYYYKNNNTQLSIRVIFLTFLSPPNNPFLFSRLFLTILLIGLFCIFFLYVSFHIPTPFFIFSFVLSSPFKFFKSQLSFSSLQQFFILLFCFC
jgi:hypothetical protein